MTKWLALLLLLPALAFGADEDIAPDDELEQSGSVCIGTTSPSCGTACNAGACELAVDEDPDGSLDGATVGTYTGTDAAARFSFGLPSADPSTAGNAQAMDLRMTKRDDAGLNCEEDSGGGDPTFDAAVYCNGSSHESLVTGQAISALDVTYRYTWTFGGTCDSSGSDVELYIMFYDDSGGPNQRMAAVEALEWEVTWATEGRRVIVVQ